MELVLHGRAHISRSIKACMANGAKLGLSTAVKHKGRMSNQKVSRQGICTLEQRYTGLIMCPGRLILILLAQAEDQDSDGTEVLLSYT